MNDNSESALVKGHSCGVRKIMLTATALAATALAAMALMAPAVASASDTAGSQPKDEARTAVPGPGASHAGGLADKPVSGLSSAPSGVAAGHGDVGQRPKAEAASQTEENKPVHRAFTETGIPVGPYSIGKDGVKSPLAKSITIMTNNGVGDSQEAGVTGDWTKEGADGLKIWQGNDPLKAMLKVCVNDGLNGGSPKTHCVNSVSDADYGVSTGVEKDADGQVRLKGLAFQSTSLPAIATTDKEPKYIYVRLPSDFSDPNAPQFSGGQIVALPVVRDYTSPAVPTMTVHEGKDGACEGEDCKGVQVGADFTGLQHSVLQTREKVLHTGVSGVVVTLSVRDAGASAADPTRPSDSGSSESSPVAAESGVDHIAVRYKGLVLTDDDLQASACNVAKAAPPAESKTFQFCINWNLMQKIAPLSVHAGRTASASINDFSVIAYDVAGNASDFLRFDQSAPFKGEKGAVVDRIQLYRFPTEGDMKSFNFSTVVYRSSEPAAKLPASTKPDDPTIVQGEIAYAQPSLKADGRSDMLQWFDDLAVFKPMLKPEVKDLKTNTDLNLNADCDPNKDCSVRHSFERDLTELREGSYSVRFVISYGGDDRVGRVNVPSQATGLNTETSYVLLDGTAPTIGLTAKGEETSIGNSYRLPDLPMVSVRAAGAQNKDDQGVRFAIRLQDLLKGSDPGNVRAMNEPGASGLSLDSTVTKAQFSYVRYSEYADAVAAVSGKSPRESGVPATVTWSADDLDESGNVLKDVVLPADGAYLIRDMKVTVSDKAGNTAVRKFGRQDGQFNPGYDILVMEGAIKDKKVGIKLKDADGTPASQTSYYHRGSVSAVVSVNDKWFAVARQLQRNQIGAGKLIFGSAPKGSIDVDDRAFPVFERKAGTDTWTYAVRLPSNPVSSGPDSGKTVEGVYRLGVSYRSMGGQRIGLTAKDGSSDSTNTIEFVVDYTAPSFDSIHYTPTDHRKWGWIFAQSQRIDVRASDNVSGVCAASGANACAKANANPTFDGRWTGEKGSDEAFSITGTGSDGTNASDLSISFSRDFQRLTFAGSRLTITDKAGNSNTLDLGDTVPSKWSNARPKPGAPQADELGKGAIGVCIDKSAPMIKVDFDNNNVRNGKYYKSKRTATVSITESSFDLIKANDKYSKVADTTADKTKTDITADKFENPSGDGKVWVARVPFDRDADWSFDVSLSDPFGHQSAPYSSQFVIDTTKPRLSVHFDNDHAENGRYFKAARTATIRQVERNFSVSDTSVTVSAKDASGAAAALPAVGQWSEQDKDYGRTAVVPFTRELHYSLKVEATDLAGNTAEAVVEPEFVIDFTSPSLSISGVTDRTAYAGAVRPKIDFGDTNFDPVFADWKLTRTRQTEPSGKADKRNAKLGKNKENEVYLRGQEKVDGTSKSVALPDIEHTVGNDDVYTLTASVKDKAGNEAKRSVRFSLNRFGSNYLFDDSTQGIIGRFIKVPQDVKVVEINVSGLQQDRSHIELVHDQNVAALERGRDYRLVEDDTSGWQSDTYVFPARLFAVDGYYRLRMTSTDQAGNLSQNTMGHKDKERKRDAQVNFAVDETAPVAAVAQLKTGSITYSPSRVFVVDANDDVALKSAQLKVDGRVVRSWNDVSSLSPMTYRLQADQKPHDIEVLATDKAGNVSTATYSGVVVATSWWAYAMANGVLLPGIFAGIVMLAFCGVGLVMAIRHRRAVAYRTNVFGR